MRLPFEGLEGGGELVDLRLLLVLDSIIEELTHSVHLLVAEVAKGSEVERYGRQFNADTATASN